LSSERSRRLACEQSNNASNPQRGWYFPRAPGSAGDERGVYFENIQYYDTAKIDFARNRMDLNIDADGYESYLSGDVVRTVRIDIVLKGLGTSTITSDESGEILDWTEIWYDVKAWGRVDGHRIAGPNTRTNPIRMGYGFDGWERTT
jgi:hypothetical protein